MLIAHAIFDDHGRPLGKAIEDTESGAVRFRPRDVNERLVNRTWRSLKACRRAVMACSAGTTGPARKPRNRKIGV